MAEFTASRLWLMRLAFVGLCVLLIYLHLLPLETTPRRWAGPDLIVALASGLNVKKPAHTNGEGPVSKLDEDFLYVLVIGGELIIQ